MWCGSPIPESCNEVHRWAVSWVSRAQMASVNGEKTDCIETWLTNANRGCKANVITIQGRCTRVVKLLRWNQLRQFYLCSRQSGVSRVAGNVLMPCALGEFRIQIQHWNAFSYQSVCLGPQKFSLPVRCTNSLSGSLGTWCKRPCLTALRNEWASLSKSLSIFSINGRGFGIMKCWPPVKSSNRFRHTTRQVNTTVGARAQLLQPEDSATTNLEVKRFQSYLLAIDVHAPCHPFCPSPGHSWQQAMPPPCPPDSVA